MTNKNKLADLLTQAADLIECKAEDLRLCHIKGHELSDHLAEQNYIDELTVANHLRRLVRKIPQRQRLAEKIAAQALADCSRMLQAGKYESAAQFASAAHTACETLVVIQKEQRTRQQEAAA